LTTREELEAPTNLKISESALTKAKASGNVPEHSLDLSTAMRVFNWNGQAFVEHLKNTLLLNRQISPTEDDVQ
jgi:hypothetical protein